MRVSEQLTADLQATTEAARATIGSLIYPVCNVLGYGAKGDGVTDDTLAIQRAIEAARAVGQGVVFFPSGVYLVSDTLTVYGNMTITGAIPRASYPSVPDSAGVVIQMKDGINKDTIRSSNVTSESDWVHSLTIENLMIKAGNGQTSGSGINLWSLGENSLIRRVMIQNFPEAGIKLGGTHAPAQLESLSIFRCGKGIWFYKSTSTVYIRGLSGDDNDQMVVIEYPDQVPSNGGGFCNIVIEGIKAETFNDKHNPLILGKNMNSASITLIGGRIFDYSAAKTANKPVVKMTGTAGHVMAIDCQAEGYPVWVQDDPSNLTRPFPPNVVNRWGRVGILSHRFFNLLGSSKDDADSIPTLHGIGPGLRFVDPSQASGDNLITGGGPNGDMSIYRNAGTYDAPNWSQLAALWSWGGLGSKSGFTIGYMGQPFYVQWTAGAGSPEGVVQANVGSLYTRTNGGAGTTLYVKESGTGNTGWVAK